MKGNLSGSLRLLMRLTAVTLALLCGIPMVQAQPVARPASSIVQTTSKLFEFHSAFWINLHHVLYVQARARMQTPDSTRPSVVKARDDLAMLHHLDAAQRRVWEAALDYYES